MTARGRSPGPPRGHEGRRFSYYARLDAAEKRVYRKSDAITAVRLPRPQALRRATLALERGLASEKRRDAENTAQALVNGITELLEVPSVKVKVRSVRPSEHGGELHGLYTWEDGEVPVIEVWMRTAQQRRTVAFRTFLRTLFHEVCHHLDFTLYGFEHTFHTEGFFRRESSLVRQLAGPPGKKKRTAEEEMPSPEPFSSPPEPHQLRLFS